MIVLVDSDPDLNRPTVRSHLRQFGSTLARRGQNVGFVAWHQLDVLPERVSIRGPVVGFDGGAMERTAHPPRALLIHPTSGGRNRAFTDSERRALGRLRALGLVRQRERPTRLACLARILAAAARCGIVVNAPGLLGRWGRKDGLEMALREAVREGAPRVPRPETYVVPGAQVWVAVSSFHRRGKTCLVKPANGTRGERICVLSPGQMMPGTKAGTWIVQELLERPLLVDGHKADLRAFLCVDLTRGLDVRLLPPVLVRVAGYPYEKGSGPAEITNTAFRARHGFSPATSLLNDAIADPRLKAEILSSLESLVDNLSESLQLFSASVGRSPQVLVWGIDVFVGRSDGMVSTQILEINVYPRLFRGVLSADEAVSSMWLDEVLPRIINVGYAQ